MKRAADWANNAIEDICVLFVFYSTCVRNTLCFVVAISTIPPHSSFVVFLLSSSLVITFPHLQSFPINMSPAALKSNCYGDIFCDTCSKHDACWAARRTEGGLSGMAGLASITMSIETAAQSSVLHSQIRPLDKKALQLDPTHYNGGVKIRYVTHNPWQCAPVKYFTFSLWFNSLCC